MSITRILLSEGSAIPQQTFGRAEADLVNPSPMVLCLRCVQAVIATPTLLFLATLTLILFRPPNVGLLPMDRIAFLFLIFIVVLRTFLLREELPFQPALTLPMLGLLVLALRGNWVRPFDAEAWSLVAAKFVVPFVMFHVAALVFTTDSAVRKLEIFCLLVLAYLCFVSIAFIGGAHGLIFPRFIVTDAVGMHADRARGPFLQAVANGLTLNLLGLLAVHLYQRGRLRLALAIPLLLALPIAIFATMTRSVWLSFVVSMTVVMLRGQEGRVPRAAVCLTMGAILVVCLSLANSCLRSAFQDRFANRETIEFRFAVYRLSWDMVQEKPLLGWSRGELARQIEARISDYRPESYAAHNTFIEILVEHGIVGIALYAWLAISLFRLGTRSDWLHFVWPLLLGVYFLNACFVVMNYQFVNALVFTFAGVLAAQNRRSSDLITH